MAKSCHDLDILNHYFHPLKPLRVSSFGSLTHFKKSSKPIEAKDAKKCLNCSIQDTCPYSATRIYLERLKKGNFTGWPVSVVLGDEGALLIQEQQKHNQSASSNGLMKDIEDLLVTKLAHGPYGQCVYESPNDVCDHQVVNVEYEGGKTASFTMVAFTEIVCQRQTRIHGTQGEIIGDMSSFSLFDFKRRVKKIVDPSKEMNSGHGGGDFGLMGTFVEAVREGNQSLLGCDIDDVFASHVLVFAAEHARRTGTVVNIEEFIRDFKG
jgi:hypothetical protein